MGNLQGERVVFSPQLYWLFLVCLTAAGIAWCLSSIVYERRGGVFFENLPSLSERELVNLLAAPSCDESQAREIARQLSKSSNLDRASIQALLELANENKFGSKVSFAILKVLQKNHQAIALPEQLAGLLKCDDELRKIGAISVLLHFSEFDNQTKKAAQDCLAANCDRVCLVREIGRTGDVGKKMTWLLYKVLDDPDRFVKCVVIDELARVRANRSEFKDVLKRILSDSSSDDLLRDHVQRHLEELSLTD